MTGSNDSVLYVRIPRVLAKLLDREVVRQQKANPGANVNKSDVVRTLLFERLMPKKRRK